LQLRQDPRCLAPAQGPARAAHDRPRDCRMIVGKEDGRLVRAACELHETNGDERYEAARAFHFRWKRFYISFALRAIGAAAKNA
jgi:hypothetical protein